ncbi:hypothetical protein BAUCODRAFT_24881 [Baudoinia panamericana UAMH 10762]|uniref:DUF7702 domain-containing protein n=1 Tax=Baudoinia panamericana (strain UAMH 10762) TaxID=717646 RepID=M2N9U1_BAUPA|nr:uncharacterized protein BAUCODRAFT_24881 [Baudoinia panamericana UAMH 10762]EMC95894.1 hypothetical protein BAUCODRAFT_24881 [Baudoinia panamericana UAMH 10762]
MLAPTGDLAAVEIAFFSLAFTVSLFVVIRHGFRRELGWIYLLILSLLRLIGGSVTLYMQVNHDYNKSLITTATITSAVGTSPLLLATMGFLQRISEGMEPHGVTKQLFRPLHIVSLGALIIAIIGGTDRSSSDPNTMQTGKDLAEAASILFLAILVGLGGIVAQNIMNLRFVLSSEKNLLRAAVVALPFLLVRVIYTVASSFSGPGSPFYYRDENVYLQAFMQFLMEAIIVTIFIAAGLLTPKAEIKTGNYDLESARSKSAVGHQPDMAGNRPSRPQWQPQSVGDYRPSRLIRNALQSR